MYSKPKCEAIVRFVVTGKGKLNFIKRFDKLRQRYHLVSANDLHIQTTDPYCYNMRNYRRNVNIYVLICCAICGAIIVLVIVGNRQGQSSYRWFLKNITDITHQQASPMFVKEATKSDDKRNSLLQRQTFKYLARNTAAPSVGQITHLRLVNATITNLGQPLIDPLVNGTVINLQDYPTDQQFSIEALVNNASGPIGSIRFINVDGKRATENFVKYSLCGDKKGSFTNCSALSQVGTNYTVKATPYSLINTFGIAGTAHTVYFSVVNDTPPGWVTVNSAAPIWKRHEACFVMVGRKGYLIAGRARRNVEIYDVIHRTWSVGAKPPIQLHHSQCVVADNKIWIVSSWTGGYPMETNAEYIYVRITSIVILV